MHSTLEADVQCGLWPPDMFFYVLFSPRDRNDNRNVLVELILLQNHTHNLDTKFYWAMASNSD